MRIAAMLGAALCLVAAAAWVGVPAAQAMDLTTQKPIVLHLQLGGEGAKTFRFTPDHLDLQTGKLYELIFHNAGQIEHEFDSPELMERVFHSKLQVLDPNGKVLADIEARLDELQLQPGQTVAWYFVPVRTTDEPVSFVCDLPGHLEAGMKGTVTIR
jgi:uncharacterized cupredoxin-like copper-binding protein